MIADSLANLGPHAVPAILNCLFTLDLSDRQDAVFAKQRCREKP